jgi:hypothetical protein
MSTPIEPPGSPPPGGAEPGDDPGAERAEGRPGEFREAVESAAEADVGPADGAPEAAGTSSASPLGDIRQELAAGRIDVDQAVERLVQRALGSAAGLPESDRAALEAQLREALSEDPTLLALRRDLERASKP